MTKSAFSTFHFLIITGSIFLFAMAGCKHKKEILSGDVKVIQLSPEVRTLRDAIMAANYIGTEQVSRKPGMDPNYANRLKLMRIASDDELLTLTGNTNAVVSLTAFEGLYERGNKIVPVIFEGYRSRSDMIQYLRGDISTQMPLLEYAYVYVMHYKIPDEKSPSQVEDAKPKFELPEAEQRKVVLKIADLRAAEEQPKY